MKIEMVQIHERNIPAGEFLSRNRECKSLDPVILVLSADWRRLKYMRDAWNDDFNSPEYMEHIKD